jgi:predicted MFS family arabinose efflux permease
VALSWSDHPGRELGNVFSASVVGFLVGPVAGAVLADAFGLTAPFVLAAGAMVLVLPFVSRMSAPAAEKQRTDGGVLTLLRRRMVAAGVLLAATEFFSVGALEAVWARLLTDNGASTTFIGVGFAVILLPLMVLSPVGGRLADRYRPLRVGLVAAACVVPVLLLYGWVTTLVGLLAAGAVHATLSAAIAPSAGAAVAEGSPRDQVAQGQGLLEAFGFLAAAVAAAGAGWLYGAVGATGLFTALAAGALVLVVAAFVVGRPAFAPKHR